MQQQINRVTNEVNNKSVPVRAAGGDKRQTTMISRYRSGIKAYKVLDIVGCKLVFRLFPNSDETEKIHVDMPDAYSVGEYVDLIVIRRSRTSKSIELVGHTPQQFVPANNSDIGD